MKLTKRKSGAGPGFRAGTKINLKGKKVSLEKMRCGIIYFLLFAISINVVSATSYSTVQYANQTTGVYSQSGIVGPISTNPTFADGTIFNNDVYIMGKTIVIITGTIHMGPKAVINVEPTATLIINGGTITGTSGHTSFTTNLQSNWWGGIQVLGTPTKRQPPIASIKNTTVLNNSYSQGTTASSIYGQGALWIYNSATIEYSYRGICAGLIGGAAGFGGGVIICENCSLTNNYLRAIFFDTYSTLPYTNQSYCTGCTFTYDGTYDQAHALSPATIREFIYAQNTIFSIIYPQTNIFSTNTFTISNYEVGSGGTIPFGDNYIGIWTSDAILSAYGNTFTNLLYGININATSDKSANLVTSNTFNYCDIGIRDNGLGHGNFAFNYMTNVGVQNNGFSLPILAPQGAGIWCNGVNGFQADENTVISQSAPNNQTGIYSKNSGSGSSLITANEVHELSNGMTFEGNNLGSFLSCNSFDLAVQDLLVATDATATSGTAQGIAPVQGDPFLPTLNHFDNTGGTPTSDWHQNAGVGKVSYYYHSGSSNYPVYYTNTTNTTGSAAYAVTEIAKTAAAIDCLPFYLTHSLPAGSFVVRTLTTTLASLPGPNTGTADQIAQYSNVEHERQAAIDYMVTMYLTLDTVSATPDSMQLINHIHDAIGYLTDSVTDSIVNYHLINLYIAEAQYDSASTIVSYLASTYPTDSEVRTTCSYYAILINGLSNNFNSTWATTYTSTLQGLAATGHFIQAKAQSLLQNIQNMSTYRDTTDSIKVLTIRYPPTFALADDGGYTEEKRLGIGVQNNNALWNIQAYPDPVTDMLQININNGTTTNETLHLSICDNLGKICVDQIIIANTNTSQIKSIDMTTLAKGIYSITIIGSNGILHTQAIVKQ